MNNLWRSRFAKGLAFVLLLAAAFSFRWVGQNWDQGFHLHPDERHITMIAADLSMPQSPDEFFNTSTSPLNPYKYSDSYAYGTMPLFLTRFVAEQMHQANYDGIVMVGRMLSALMDLLTVTLVCLIGRQLFDSKTGLLAAAFYAVCVLPIQQAHFFTADSFGTAMITASLLFCCRTAQGRSRMNLLAACFFFGAALACRINLILFAPIICIALVRRESFQHPALPAHVALLLLSMVSAGAVFLVTFRVLQPYAFSGPSFFNFSLSHQWLTDIRHVSGISTGKVDVPFTLQWTGRTQWLFPWLNMVRWGTGWALGLCGTAGILLYSVRSIRKPDLPRLLPLIWGATLFLYHGAQYNMTMRYFLPVYPLLCLFATALFTDTFEPFTRRHHWPWPWLWNLPLVAVLVATSLWAGAFIHIYAKPHTRVAASQWMIDELPAGSFIATEHWDDRLPLWNGSLPFFYESLELYNQESPAKLEQLLRQLDHSDYIVLSSRRLCDSITRAPKKYPVASRYYKTLFSGELGFDPVAHYTSPPTLAGFTFPDQIAEEAFTVYDHPEVMIFQKSYRWTPDKARQLLSKDVDWNAIAHVPGSRLNKLPREPLLSPAQWDSVSAGGTWSRLIDPVRGLFNRTGVSNVHPIVFWVILLVMLQVISFPLFSSLLRKLPDHGWLLARLNGTLLSAWILWFFTRIGWLSNSENQVRGLLALLLICAVIQYVRHRISLAHFFKSRWQLILTGELVFWLTFLAFFIIRSGNPDLWNPWFGGEKPMDFAFFNATLKSTVMPPYNPWFAGGYINYYYFGFVLASIWVKCTGIMPQLSYNMIVATFAAMTAASAFTASSLLSAAFHTNISDSRSSFRLRRRRMIASGIIGVLLVLFIGNLAQWRILLFEHNPPAWDWFWKASRAIKTPAGDVPPITEFPLFTYMYGDLHAHLMAMPVFLSIIALGCAIIRKPTWSLILWAGFAAASLYPVNAWDYPTAMAMLGLAILIAQVACCNKDWKVLTITSILKIVTLIVFGRIMFLFFHMDFQTGYGGFSFWPGPRTAISDYLLIHTMFLLPLIGGYIVYLMRRRIFSPNSRPILFFHLGLVGGAFALTILVEFIVLIGDIGRMNTVFKFYLQVWNLFALTSASISTVLIFPIIGTSLKKSSNHWNSSEKKFQSLELSEKAKITPNVPTLGQRPSKIKPRTKNRKTTSNTATCLRITFAVISITLWLGGMLYPVLAIPAYWKTRFDADRGFGIDGQAFMSYAYYTYNGYPIELSGDLEAIRWIQDHVKGTPVILEGQTSEYTWSSRYSIHTGLPTIIGWSWHQRQQRSGQIFDAVAQRMTDVATIYNTEDVPTALALLRKYNVRLIVIGELERLTYDRKGIKKFSPHAMPSLKPVYKNNNVTVYELPSPPVPSSSLTD